MSATTQAAPTTEVMLRSGRGTGAETAAGTSRPLAWSEAQDRFLKGGWFWLSTVRPDGRPHAMPCFAAWSGPTFFVATKEGKRKTRNLDADWRCVLTKDAGDAHLIVEGRAARVRDEATLTRDARLRNDLRVADQGCRGRARRRLWRSDLRRPAIPRVRDHAVGGVRPPDRRRGVCADPLALRALTIAAIVFSRAAGR